MPSISDKIFERLKENHMSQAEFARQTGISTSTINDWKIKGNIPSADKIMNICHVLEMTTEELLTEEGMKDSTDANELKPGDRKILDVYHSFSEKQKKRMMSYMRRLTKENHDDIHMMVLEGENNLEEKIKRNVSVIKDVYGNNIVMINDICFKGKRNVNWDDVEEYLRQYVGEFYTIADTKDIIYIGADLPGEYKGSVYTRKLKGTVAKAKANAAQGIPEMIEIAVGKHYRENQGEKHKWNARLGWYRYDSAFALPVYDENGQIQRYNVFHASLLIRHANDGQMYLYDVIDIKKETSNPLES